MGSIDLFINRIYEIYLYLIIGYVLLSWIPNARGSFIGELLAKIVEPYLKPFRKLIPPIGGMLDISPIVALFALKYVALGLKVVVMYIAGLIIQ